MWEHVWQLVSAGFDEVAQALRAGNAQLWCQSGRQSNETFPFWAYASLGHMRGEEDVVLTVSFKEDRGDLVFTCDIALGDGRVLAELPEERVSSSAATLEEWVLDGTDDAIRFFKANDAILRTELLR